MQRTPSNSPPTGPAKPSKALPPIRMGDRSDWVRKEKAKAEEKHVAESKIRTRIYQDILTLLDLAERLTLDLSCHEDRFGIEWSALAKQIHAQYHAAVVQIVPGFQAKIMSKEGAHGLPKGLYRHLLDFAEECVAFVKWTRSPSTGNFDGAPGSMSAPPRQESEFMQAGQRFHQACVDMRQQICIFENERPAGEESFFG